MATCALAVPSAASACSYVFDPGTTQDERDRAALRTSDAAFIGTVVAYDLGTARATYVYRVERAVKGRFPLGYVHVRSNTTSCGLYARLGDRTGLTVNRRRGGWWAWDIDRITPRALLRAARPH